MPTLPIEPTRIEPTLRDLFPVRTVSIRGVLLEAVCRGGLAPPGGSNPALGGLQILQSNVITQSRLLSYIDIYFGLAVLAGLGLIFLAIARVRQRPGRPFFHQW